MARLEKTIQSYQKQLKNKDIKDIPKFIQSILNSDITKGKYSRFLLDCYLNDKFREEDLKGGLESTIGQAITLFHKHKGKLSEEMRSVYQYDSPGDLWNAVKQFDGQLSGKELKKDEKEKIYGETEFIYENEETGFKIISPLTEEAAKWWGKGTRWCTSADKNNQFKNYAKNAPLLILLMPGGEKLQLWQWEDDIQFMDEADNNVSLDYIEDNIEILEPIILWLGDLRYIPESCLTYDVYKQLLYKNNDIVRNIPNEYRTKDMCELAIEIDGENLLYFPEEHKDYNICLKAVQNNGFALNGVPEKYKNEELYKISVQQNGNALYQVPEEYKTEELCKIAVQSNGMSLYHVPEKYKTDEICKLAVQQNGGVLLAIPSKLITEELCKTIIQKDKNAIPSIPSRMFSSYSLCLLVIHYDKYGEFEFDGLAQSLFCYIPEEYKTEELCKLAVQSNGNALEYIPEQYMTNEICEFAVQNNGFALSFIPNELLTEKIYQLALEQEEDAIMFVPSERQDEMQKYIKHKPMVIPEEKYQTVFKEIYSQFPDKITYLKM